MSYINEVLGTWRNEYDCTYIRDVCILLICRIVKIVICKQIEHIKVIQIREKKIDYNKINLYYY